MQTRFYPLALGFILSAGLSTPSHGAAPGLPFVEDFADTNLRDATHTNANWSTEEQAVLLNPSRPKFGVFEPGSIFATGIAGERRLTTSLAMGDVNGDGGLDLVVGAFSQEPRLYLNYGGTFGKSAVTGINITSDVRNTTSVALGDVDGDGDLDVMVGNDYSPSRLYLNNGTFNPFFGAAGNDITTDGTHTYAVAFGDMNGDGNLDLVAGNNSIPSRLYLNNGTPTPFAGVSGKIINSDTRTTLSAALGDVDGDGDLDIVFGNFNSTNRLYLNNGTGDPFAGVTGLDITADVWPTRSVALGDMDGDGDLDLVVGNFEQSCRLYLNNGTADPFMGVTGTIINYDIHSTTSVALGDVDCDGDLDLVAGNDTNQVNRLYLNNGTPQPFFNVSGVDITADAHLTKAVALGDVNGDGDLDLVAGNYFPDFNRLYLNLGTSNQFGVGTDIITNTDDKVWIVSGDMDGDGDLDIVAADRAGTNKLYLSNGSTDPFSGVTGSQVTSDANVSERLAVADFNGDGHLDLVAGNFQHPNRLYLNNGTADPFNGVAGTNISDETGTTDALVPGDLDGDGDLDLAVGSFDKPTRIHLNNGTQAPFDGVAGIDLDVESRLTQDIALGDFDGDGDLDLIDMYSFQGARLYLNNGTADPFAGVMGEEIPPDRPFISSVALGDLDGDGDLDIVAGNFGSSETNRLYLNNGTSAPFTGVMGKDLTTDKTDTTTVLLGDIDGDGDLDVITRNEMAPNRLYLNNGTSDPFAGVDGIDVSPDLNDQFATAFLADMDRDGYLDLVVANRSTTPVRMYRNNGTRVAFAPLTGSNITPDSHVTRAVVLGDVDRDGDLDVVVGNRGSGEHNRLYLNNGTLEPFLGVAGTDITSDANETRSVVLGDVDSDGDLDVVAGNLNHPNRLYLNNGTSNPFNGVSGKNVTTDTNSTAAVALGDVDSDGDLDLVAGNFGQTLRLYLNNGTADPFNGVTGSDISGDIMATRSVALGDVDRDGDLDVVAGNYGQPNRLYLNNGTSTPFGGVTGSDISTDTDHTTSVAIADLNREGHLDVLVGNEGEHNKVYLNSGNSNPFGFATGFDAGTDIQSTQSVALADMDRDGNPDYVAGNFSGTNRFYIYVNNGLSTPFAAVPGSEITSDVNDTFSVAVGDVNGDGKPDVVAGNRNSPNRLYVRGLTFLPQGRATSLTVDTQTEDVQSVLLEVTETIPTNTSIEYWVTNGGFHWFLVHPGTPFTFPTAGSDLHWKAELKSLSPIISPRLEELRLRIGKDSTLTGGSLSFGPRTLTSGPSPSMSVTLKNTGFEVLSFTGSGAAITGGDADQFTFSPIPALSPLAPGASRGIGVVFDPSRLGPALATLQIFTDDPADATRTVPLSGTGVVAPTPTPTPSVTVTPTPTPTTNYDIFPTPNGDGNVDARDLLEWLKRIESGPETGDLTLDFARFWKISSRR
jgi:hypothetical protein